MAKLLSGTRVYGTATVDSQLIVVGTYTSTSTLTGALLVSGGVGIRGDLWVAGTINGTIGNAGTANQTTNLNGGTTGSIPYQSATSTTNFVSIATTSGWVLTSNGTLPVWQSIGIVSTANSISTIATNTTDAHFLTFVNSNNNAATAESLYTTSTISIIPSTGEVDILSTVPSVSSLTGALVVSGGVGIKGDLYVGGLINGTIAGADSAGTANTATNLAGGDVGSIPYQSATSSTTFLSIGSSGKVLVSNGTTPEWQNSLTLASQTQSISTTTGALVVSGGIGIGKDLTLDGSIRYFTNNTSTIKSYSEILEGVQNLVFEGSQGRLLTVSDTFTGTIFSVARDDGIPSIEVLDTGTILLNEYGGWVEILSTTTAISSATGALVVNGGVGIKGDLYVGGLINGTIAGADSAGTANTATNLAGGDVGSIPYQSATSSTTFLSIATTSGWRLVSNGTTPEWQAGGDLLIENDIASTDTHYISFLSTTTGTTAAIKTGDIVYQPSTGNVGIGTASLPIYKLEVNGSFAATTKSFLIDHPTKSGWRLRYGSLEGPENGIYFRGRLTNSSIINLPDYWKKLIDITSITVNLTPIGRDQNIYVKEINENYIVIENSNMFNKDIDCFYIIFAERIDVEKLTSEIPPNLNG